MKHRAIPAAIQQVVVAFRLPGLEAYGPLAELAVSKQGLKAFV
jgi:hypothetical protein